MHAALAPWPNAFNREGPFLTGETPDAIVAAGGARPYPAESRPASERLEGETWERWKEVHHGKLVGGKYRIGGVIGAGAMGTVVAARDVNLGRKVAIKFLKADALADAGAVARFFVEARAAAQLASDHAVRVYGVDRLDDGTPYIVMEYLEGCDLAQWLWKHKSAPIAQAVGFIVQACDALQEAHERGIVHRDIKPANLFAVERARADPRIKVLDFGISKMEVSVSETRPPEDGGPKIVPTQRSAIFGSFPYMSPEQMESARDVDRRTDIWSLGVTLWELLSGERPFRAASIVGLHAMVMAGTHLRLRGARPQVSPELEAILLRCLAPNREERYGSVQELMDELRRAPLGDEAAGNLPRSERPMPVASTDPGVRPVAFSSGTPPEQPLSRNAKATPRPRRFAWWRLPMLAIAVGLLSPLVVVHPRRVDNDAGRRTARVATVVAAASNAEPSRATIATSPVAAAPPSAAVAPPVAEPRSIIEPDTPPSASRHDSKNPEWDRVPPPSGVGRTSRPSASAPPPKVTKANGYLPPDSQN